MVLRRGRRRPQLEKSYPIQIIFFLSRSEEQKKKEIIKIRGWAVIWPLISPIRIHGHYWLTNNLYFQGALWLHCVVSYTFSLSLFLSPVSNCYVYSTQMNINMMEFKHVQSRTKYTTKRESEKKMKIKFLLANQSMSLSTLFKVLSLKLLFSQFISLFFHFTRFTHNATHQTLALITSTTFNIGYLYVDKSFRFGTHTHTHNLSRCALRISASERLLKRMNSNAWAQ